MTREIEDRKRELYKQTKVLREIATDAHSFEEQKEIRKQQDVAYNKLKFIKNLEKALRKK